MGRDPKARQKAQARKAVKQKQKQKQRQVTRVQQPRARVSLKGTGDWPLMEVLLSKGWDEDGALVEILVARRSPLGQVATGKFLVDLGCLGVKSAFASLFTSEQEYVQELRSHSPQPMRKADLNLVAKIIREGIAYARELGFQPDPDYRDAMLVLGAADPDACAVHIPLGAPDGKPFFVAGPYDDAQAIISKLTRKLGPDGFHFMAPMGLGPGELEFLP